MKNSSLTKVEFDTLVASFQQKFGVSPSLMELLEFRNSTENSDSKSKSETASQKSN